MMCVSARSEVLMKLDSGGLALCAVYLFAGIFILGSAYYSPDPVPMQMLVAVGIFLSTWLIKIVVVGSAAWHGLGSLWELRSRSRWTRMSLGHTSQWSRYRSRCLPLSDWLSGLSRASRHRRVSLRMGRAASAERRSPRRHGRAHLRRVHGD